MPKVITDYHLLGGLFGSEVAELIEAEKAAKKAKEDAEREARRDEIGERLVADGFFHSEYLLESDGAFNCGSRQKEYEFPWNLPSRLFTFPMQTLRGPDGVRRIALRHPLLAEHPLVKELLSKGYELVGADECLNRCGVSLRFMDYGLWWHAVDLIEKNHRNLLKTRQFTTEEHIFGAVIYRCEYPHDSPLKSVVSEMREVMCALGSAEPGGREIAVKGFFNSPKAEKENISYHSVRLVSDQSESIAWAFIHGIEEGWFTAKNGFLRWSRKGFETFTGAK